MFVNSRLFFYLYGTINYQNVNCKSLNRKIDMTLVDRFLKYVSFDTQSDESTGLTPSTPKQMVFAEYLKTELESLGLEDITLDEHGYLFATLPANIDKEVPTIGFIAHMDTSPDMTGKDVTPRIVKGYDGTDIVLCAEENIILSPAQFP